MTHGSFERAGSGAAALQDANRGGTERSLGMGGAPLPLRPAARALRAPAALRPLPSGAAAPPFTLRTGPDQTCSLSDARGHAVVVAFYLADWHPVCADQLALYNEVLPEFQKYGADLLGISVDSVWSHLAFRWARGLRFPLLSDFEPKGAVARAYRAYRRREGTSARALFVIDGSGVIRWSYLSPPGIVPGVDGILDALEACGGG
jgi:peroxiredoxin